MARRSASDRYCRLWKVTSAMGPNTEPRAEVPLPRMSTMSWIDHSPSPASRLEVSEGAYQYWLGIRPPAKACDSLLPPSMLMAEWHMAQWARPSTR